jgi:hypothetical protein
VVADFASEYGIRLGVTDLSWREFLSLLTGLLVADTRLYRHFAADKSDEGSQP